MDRVPNIWPTVRGFLTALVNAQDAEQVDLVPAGYRNNLRWHLGHVLTAGEGLTVARMGLERSYPSAWTAFFDMGTGPASFTADTPTWSELLVALDRSTSHISAALEGSSPDAPLAEPFGQPGGRIYVETLGGMVAFMAWHEGAHFGVMRAMKAALGEG